MSVGVFTIICECFDDASYTVVRSLVVVLENSAAGHFFPLSSIENYWNLKQYNVRGLAEWCGFQRFVRDSWPGLFIRTLVFGNAVLPLVSGPEGHQQFTYWHIVKRINFESRANQWMGCGGAPHRMGNHRHRATPDRESPEEHLL